MGGKTPWVHVGHCEYASQADLKRLILADLRMWSFPKTFAECSLIQLCNCTFYLPTAIGGNSSGKHCRTAAHVAEGMSFLERKSNFKDLSPPERRPWHKEAGQ